MVFTSPRRLVGEPQTGPPALDQPGVRRPLRPRKTRKLGPKRGPARTVVCSNRPGSRTMSWTCDFIHDRTAAGRPLKWLTLVDEYTRECLVLHASGSLSGVEVRRILARVIGRRGAPTRIRSDNGSEFICAAMVDWLPGVGAESIPVAAEAPGKMDISNRLQSVARRVLRTCGIQGRGGCSSEGVLVPAGIQRGPASQLARLCDAERVQRGL